MDSVCLFVVRNVEQTNEKRVSILADAAIDIPIPTLSRQSTDRWQRGAQANANPSLVPKKEKKFEM